MVRFRDTLVLDSLDCLFDIIDDKDGFFITEDHSILYNGVFWKQETNPVNERMENGDLQKVRGHPRKNRMD